MVWVEGMFKGAITWSNNKQRMQWRGMARQGWLLEEKVKCPEIACDCHSYCNTNMMHQGKKLFMVQYEWWLPAHPPSPQCLVQLPEAGTKAASPRKIFCDWNTESIAEEAIGRGEQTERHQQRINMGSVDPLAELEPHIAWKEVQAEVAPEQTEDARKGKDRSLEVWGQGERSFPLCSCAFTE